MTANSLLEDRGKRFDQVTPSIMKGMTRGKAVWSRAFFTYGFAGRHKVGQNIA